MKKIININLSGRVIPIEDSAYEKLQVYIESLRRYFSKEEDRDEIINDIESRIAELMNEKIRKGASAVTDADIDEIAASMGRPEDFAAEEAADTTQSSKQTSEQQTTTRAEKRAKGRLYRDTNDKFLGGVCSGIAAYLNIDPSIVRILFAIITFGGFGLGFLAYIILWIVLPAKGVENRIGKRLYRNPDDRILGGVAGGLAAYFNREAWVVRLIFVAPFLFSIFIGFIRGITWRYDFDFVPNIVFGSLGSTFILAYIILWIVLPEARSTYEKMEMRGEKVDVNTIAQNMKDRVKEWSEEVKESAQQFGSKASEFANTRAKTFTSEVNEAARRGNSGCLHAFGVLFKVFFLFIAGTIAFGLFVGLMALIFGGMAWWPINNFLWTSNWQQIYAWGTLIFFLGVPLIGFITWVVRRILKVRSRNSYLGWTFGFLWALGWVVAVLFTASVVRDFRDFERTPDAAISVAQPANGKMIVTVSEPELQYTGRYDWMNDDSEGWDMSSDTMKLSWVNFELDKSPDSLYHVSLRKYAFGKNEGEALNRAQKIEYTVASTDSLLDLANGFSIYKDDKFRGQRVEILIQVPVGKQIRFDESVKGKLNPTELTYRRRNRRNGFDMRFHDRGAFWWRSNTDYIMQADGQLFDTTGKKVVDDQYRYEENTQPGERIERKTEEQIRRLEERERKWEEEGRRIREEKDNQKARDSVRKESIDDQEDGLTAGSPTPVFSLVRTFF